MSKPGPVSNHWSRLFLLSDCPLSPLARVAWPPKGEAAGQRWPGGFPGLIPSFPLAGGDS